MKIQIVSKMAMIYSNFLLLICKIKIMEKLQKTAKIRWKHHTAYRELHAFYHLVQQYSLLTVILLEFN